MRLLPIHNGVARYVMDDGTIAEVSVLQLAAMGFKPEDIPLLDEPSDVPADAVIAWLEGKGPKPFPEGRG